MAKKKFGIPPRRRRGKTPQHANEIRCLGHGHITGPAITEWRRRFPTDRLILRSVQLNAVNLRDVDLRNADLREAEFWACDLTGVMLDGADLTRVRMYDCIGMEDR